MPYQTFRILIPSSTIIFFSLKVHLQDVQEIQKRLKEDVEDVQKHIDCLHIKIQCVNVSVAHLLCVHF